MDWQDEYKRKLTTPEEVAKLIKSGERVAIGASTDQPRSMHEAVFARAGELRGVEIVITPMLTHPCWLEPGLEDSFKVTIAGWSGPMGRPLLLEKREHGLLPQTYHAIFAKGTEREPRHIDMDWLMIKVSPPKKPGIVSLGAYRWMKKEIARRSRKVVAEVDANQQWFYGDDTMPISEIDYFVEYADPLGTMSGVEQAIASIEDEERKDTIRRIVAQSSPHVRSMLVPRLSAMTDQELIGFEKTLTVPPEGTQTIVDSVSTLIRDGDIIQLGAGSPSGFICSLGAFNDKHDLGVHSEIACRDVGVLIEGGVITGKYNTIHPDKNVFQTLDGMSVEETEYCVENPKIELYGVEHVSDVKVISALDNFVSMNNALSVDLTGQICFESVFGGIPMHGPGGQPDFHLGAVFSKGGRAITTLYSTASGGTISRIVPQFEAGTVVSVGRAHADYIVTEYGIARLWGKSFRERAEELIAIAHPDFRAELRKEARKLFWP